MEEYIKFIRKLDNVTTEVTINCDSDLTTVLEEFQRFLTGCGYYVKGELVIVDENLAREEEEEADLLSDPLIIKSCP